MTKKKKKQNEKLKNSSKTLEIWEIEWKDHASTHGPWMDLAQITPSLISCRSVGYKVAEDKEIICLALSINNQNHSADFMNIIKSCIVKERLLSKITIVE